MAILTALDRLSSKFREIFELLGNLGNTKNILHTGDSESLGMCG